MDLRIQKDFRQLGLCFQRATLIKQSELGISVIRTTSKDGDSARRRQRDQTQCRSPRRATARRAPSMQCVGRTCAAEQHRKRSQ